MTDKNKLRTGRQKWSMPEIVRIEAGSAESARIGGVPDGSSSPSGKNFS